MSKDSELIDLLIKLRAELQGYALDTIEKLTDLNRKYLELDSKLQKIGEKIGL